MNAAYADTKQGFYATVGLNEAEFQRRLVELMHSASTAQSQDQAAAQLISLADFMGSFAEQFTTQRAIRYVSRSISKYRAAGAIFMAALTDDSN